MNRYDRLIPLPYRRCRCSIGLQSTIALDPGEAITVVYKYTYGAIIPDGADCGDMPCPWDLDSGGDVGIGDLLILLGNWGPCP